MVRAVSGPDRLRCGGEDDRVPGQQVVEQGALPHALASLIGHLSVYSEEFRVRWAAHDVTGYRSGIQPFRHPLVGDVALEYGSGCRC